MSTDLSVSHDTTPFALSLSKGSSPLRMTGFDRLSPNGRKSYELILFRSLFQLRRWLSVALLLTATGAHAQLSSPLPPGSSKPAAGKAAPAPLGSIDLPAGQGAGVHGANSPFAPLAPRTDVLPWSVLTDVKTKNEKNRILPVFNAGQLGMNDKTQRIQGFMMPLEPGKKQRHFLLSSVPLSCSFCVAGGPESMVEVKTKTPVEYSMEPVVVEGRLQVLHDDPYGLYYRITDAVTVK